jgi:hypothetical protein
MVIFVKRRRRGEKLAQAAKPGKLALISIKSPGRGGTLFHRT